MKPLNKTANDLFQMLRTRFSPITIGNEDAEVVSDPTEARFFTFEYKENDESVGTISVSIIDNRSLKVYFNHDMVENIVSSSKWYDFLKDLRFFAKQNLLMFDARDIQKDQLDTRDFEYIKQNDGPYKEEDVEITESAMYGSKRKSMQKFENATLVVYHKKTVDEEKRGSRSRHIDSIFIESNHERFRFPINYLNGARAMAVHVSEGGTPYDAVGKHIVNTVSEMQNLAKFARMTKRHATEDTEAEDIRNRVVETYHGIKKDIMRMQNPKNYRNFAENFTPTDASGEADVTSLQEKFTRKIWNEKMNDLLPSVQRALEAKVDEADIDENAFNQAAAAAARAGQDSFEFNGKTYKTKMDKETAHKLDEASPSVEKTIKDPNFVLLLKKDDAADRMIRTTKFRKADGLLAFIMSDIASRMIGDGADAVANFASQMAIDIGEEGESFGTKITPEYKSDKRLATMLAQRYLQDIKKIATDDDYANTVRKDPSEVYGAKKKRKGGYHESVEEFESWANDIFEATVGTTGTTGTTGPNAARTNQQVVKALSGGDANKARDIKRVSDKLARGQKLTPAEMPVAGEIAKNVMTTKKPTAAMQALAQDEHTDMKQTQYDGHDIMGEDPPNGIDFDFDNLSKVNWSQYSKEDIMIFYKEIENLDFEDGVDVSGTGYSGMYADAVKWLENNVLNKHEDASDTDSEELVVEKTLKVKADADHSDDDTTDTQMGSITVDSDEDRKKRAQKYRDKKLSTMDEDEDLVRESLALLKKFAGI